MTKQQEQNSRMAAYELRTTHSIELVTRWTVSRGRETYGYNICTLLHNNQRIAACNGGGYDMTGTVLGVFIENNFQKELIKLDPKKYYGLRLGHTGMRVNGGCGLNSMINILKALGYHTLTKKLKHDATLLVITNTAEKYW